VTCLLSVWQCVDFNPVVTCGKHQRCFSLMRRVGKIRAFTRTDWNDGVEDDLYSLELFIIVQLQTLTLLNIV